MEAMDRIMKQEDLARAQAVHEAAITLDSHVDIARGVYATAELDPGIDNPKLKCDLVKMEQGGVDGVFLAVFVDQTSKLNAEGYAEAQKVAKGKFEAIHRLTETMYPDRCGLARSADDVERIVYPAVHSGKRPHDAEADEDDSGLATAEPRPHGKGEGSRRHVCWKGRVGALVVEQVDRVGICLEGPEAVEAQVYQLDRG